MAPGSPPRVAVEAGAATSDDTSASAAYRLLLLAVVFDILAFGVGFGWDRRWHATHPFEDFFSPPHLFIYSTHFLATLTLVAITLRSGLRAHFGPTIRLWPFPFAVPGALAIAGGGFVITALAGVFDAVWHERFGLDETAWSFPHSMLGWGIFVAFVGVAACRIAIAPEWPIGWPSAILFGFLLIAASIERIPGPFLNNLSVPELEAIRKIPVLASEPPFQHTIRIYEQWDITRLNVLFLPLAAAGAGLGIWLLRCFDRRPLVLLGLTAALTYLSPWVPYVVPGTILALAGRRAGRRWLAAAGLAFGLVAAVISVGIARGTVGPPIFGATLSMAAFPAGAWLAERVWLVVRLPSRGRVLAFVAIAGICAPTLTGALDLYLRARTP